MKRTKSMETYLSLKPDCSIYYKSNDYQIKKKNVILWYKVYFVFAINLWALYLCLIKNIHTVDPN